VLGEFELALGALLSKNSTLQLQKIQSVVEDERELMID
jgi:hypothetical protein